MSQASRRPDRMSHESNKKGAILSPSRMVALVLAIAVGVVAYHEFQVRSAFDESSQKGSGSRAGRPGKHAADEGHA